MIGSPMSLGDDKEKTNQNNQIFVNYQKIAFRDTITSVRTNNPLRIGFAGQDKN